jgi:PAS domain S-box-containing protein
LLDLQVVRITVRDADRAVILALERPERRLGKSKIVQRVLVLKGDATASVDTAGYVEIEVDDGLKQHELVQDRRVYAFILLGQFVLSLAFILVALHVRVLRPLHNLALFSNRLASGDFDQTVGWDRPDEIGRLARQMDQMRRDLKTSFAEQQVILSNVQVGVIFVRNGTIQVANRHAENIFGYGQGALSGQTTSVLYPPLETPMREPLATEDGAYEGVLFLKRQDGSLFWAQLRQRSLDPLLPQAGSIWVIEDFTERKASEDEINNLAFYDPLTSLPNRRLPGLYCLLTWIISRHLTIPWATTRATCCYNKLRNASHVVCVKATLWHAWVVMSLW